MAKISKLNANNAAVEITNKLQKEIDSLKKEMKVTARGLIEKTIPNTVLAEYKKHPEYFRRSSSVYCSQTGTYISFDKDIPMDNNYSIPKAISDTFVTLNNEIKTKEGEMEKIISEIENTIISLGTHKRILSQFPEAAPFIPIPNTNTAIMLSIKPIRNKVKQLTTK